MYKKFIIVVFVFFSHDFLLSAERIVLKPSAYFNSNTNTMPDTIPSSIFKKTNYICSGKKNKILWLETEIPADTKPLVLKFNQETLLSAVIYKKNNSGHWYEAGKTGSLYTMKEKSLPSWQQAVILYPDVSERQSHAIRIKISTDVPTPVSIEVMHEKDFFMQFSYSTFLVSIVTGILFCFTVIIFCGGVFFKDKFFLYLAGVTISLLCHMMSVEGTGGAYIWNYLSHFGKPASMVFIFSLSTLVCGTGTTFSDNAKIFSNKKAQTAINGMLLSCIAVSIIMFFFSSQALVYFLLVFIIIMAMCVFTYICIKTSFFQDAEYKFLYSYWAAALILIIIRQFFHIMRFNSSLTLFHFFDNDMDWPVCAAYMLITLPAIKYLIIRLRSKIAQLEINTAAADERMRTADSRCFVYSRLSSSLVDPITIITNTISSATSGATRQTVDIVNKNSRTMISILNTLYALAYYESRIEKIDENGSPIQLQPFIMNCIEDEIELIKKQGNQPEIKNSISVNTCIKADQNLLAVFFQFMIYAAGQHAAPGTPLRISVDYKNEVLSYSIHINSQPIPEHDARELLDFEFINADSDANEKTHYTELINSWGVSLHIVKRIINLYNGSMAIIPDLNGNNIFARLVLEPVPIIEMNKQITESTLPDYLVPQKDTEVPAENSSLLHQHPLFSETILIIEDNLQFRTYLTNLFCQFYQVQSTGSRKEALQIVQHLAPELIISSDSDTAVTNEDMLNYFKKDTRLSAVPFVFLQNYANKKQRIFLFRHGAVAVIEKPFTTEELLSAVNAFLDNKRKARALVLADISNVVRRSMKSVSEFPGTPLALQPQDVISEEASSLLADKDSAAITPTYVQTALFTAANLSKREIEIALYIAVGKSDKEIAQRLNISPATVAVHNKKIFKKLDIHSRTELVTKVK